MRGRLSLRGRVVGTVLSAACVPLLTQSPALAAAPHAAFGAGPVVAARASEPVVIKGSQIPTWSRTAASGVAAPYPSGVSSQYSFNGQGGDNTRSAHNGFLTVPPDARTGVDPNRIAAYRWDGSAWSEVPAQVDQMYPYFLANGHSSFSVYSGTDKELTYAWNPTAHSTGEEAWKKVFGGITGLPAGFPDPNPCVARYELPGAAGDTEMAQAVTNHVVNQPTLPGIAKDDYRQAMQDPVNTSAGKAELNDDDEVAMMAGDAGVFAPMGTPQPAGTDANNGQQVTIVDPTAPTDGSAPLSYIYLFLQNGGSHFNSTNGYVQLTRDAGADTPAEDTPNADEWIDRYIFSPASTERIGTSNTGYGPNIGGSVCRTADDNDASPHITTPDGDPRPSTDRQPRDGMTITTPTYRVYASGRWMVRKINVTTPGTTSTFGPNILGRWKGRAFQSSPDSTVSVVGFEDEQVNWELNNAVLGWKAGPVRVIREIWGADSGTNVTRIEMYYRDSYDYRYHVRVHPIPADGLYMSWDFRYGDVTTYYNQRTQAGVPIDGTNSHSVGEVDQLPVSGSPEFFNTCDPTLDICSAIRNPEEVSGPNGSLVFIFDVTGASSGGNPAAVPFYRDDACFDDGTGDAPVPRPYPGEATTDTRVKNGYVDYWKAHGAPSSITYADLKCQPPQPGDPHYQQEDFASYQTMPFQAAIGEVGVHLFFTSDTDNVFLGQCVQGVVVGPTGPLSDVCITEIDAQQSIYTVPSSHAANFISPTAGGEDYGNNVVAPLQTFALPYAARTAANLLPDAPLVVLFPLAAIAAAVPLGVRRQRRKRAQAL